MRKERSAHRGREQALHVRVLWHLSAVSELHVQLAEQRAWMEEDKFFVFFKRNKEEESAP